MGYFHFSSLGYHVMLFQIVMDCKTFVSESSIGGGGMYYNSEALVFSSSFFHVKKLSVNDPKSHL